MSHSPHWFWLQQVEWPVKLHTSIKHWLLFWPFIGISPYSSTMAWLHCRLNFSLLRSGIQFIRGSRCSFVQLFNASGDPDQAMDLPAKYHHYLTWWIDEFLQCCACTYYYERTLNQWHSRCSQRSVHSDSFVWQAKCNKIKTYVWMLRTYVWMILTYIFNC